jgi:hypothetical protein
MPHDTEVPTRLSQAWTGCFLGEIYQPTDQSIRRGQNAQIDLHVSDTYITQHPFFDDATFAMEFARSFTIMACTGSGQKLFMPKTEAVTERTVSRWFA